MPATSKPRSGRTSEKAAPQALRSASRRRRRRVPQLRIRTQLLLPVVAALTGMLVLALLQFLNSWEDYRESSEAEDITRLTETLVHLVDSGQSEVGWAIATGEASLDDMDSLRLRTDDLHEEFRTRVQPVLERHPSLEDDADLVLDSLNELSWAREALDKYFNGAASAQDPATLQAYEVYRRSGDSIVEMVFSLTPIVEEPEVSGKLDALAASLRAGRLAAELQYRVLNDISSAASTGVVPSERLADAARQAGAYEEQVKEFLATAGGDTAAAFKEMRESDGPKKAEEALEVYLSGVVPKIDPQEWITAQAKTVQGLNKVQLIAAGDVNDTVDGKKVAATTSLLTTIGLLTLLSFIAVGTAISLARRISDRIDTVRENTLSAAYDELPKTVAAVTGARSAPEVDRLLEQAKDSHASIVGDTDGRDELSSLAAAFNTAHYQALRQSANQALLRLDVQAMMRTLARRGHTLIRKQQDVMEDYAGGLDSSVPPQWRTLYHLATRMRRNEENLLFLAGGEPAKRYGHPTDFGMVISDGASEIEASHRIRIDNSVTACLTPDAASDVARILAEILDNAANFSPPNTPVQVATRRNGSDLILSVQDQGIGLQPRDVEQINQRLSEPTQLTSELTATMGLLVVGRLAHQHGIQVRLHSTFGKGTLAVVTLPATAQVDVTDHQGQIAAHTPARLALAAHAANVPMAGTGHEPDVPSAIEPIVPDQLRSGSLPPRSSEPAADPSGASAESAAPSPEETSKISMTFRSVNMTLQQPSAGASDGLPRRSPGSRLIPGSIPEDGPARPRRSVQDDSSPDPNEVRSRLSGLASGIAAAEGEYGRH
ncbi:ATP-binding protein [Salininema proteolyticum]|uniref:histidine kinase n=1 Tax=Salininema proteolyticum TaxID=1607685 RepID=A0ABV8TWH2_9ACTN